jgi:hypothetical protein
VGGDDSRSCAERVKYKGLKLMLESSTCNEDLGLLLNTLLELSELSHELQNRKCTFCEVQTEVSKYWNVRWESQDNCILMHRRQVKKSHSLDNT